MFVRFRLAAASAHELFQFEVGLVCAQNAGVGLEPGEEGRLMARRICDRGQKLGQEERW